LFSNDFYQLHQPPPHHPPQLDHHDEKDDPELNQFEEE
jgi:hypothetical protein